jgi:DNA-binding YbaB/EbfC family protein
MKDLGKLMREAQRIQAEIARVQQELAEARIEGSAGGGAVRIVVSGTQDPLEVHIAPEVLEENDQALLEDLVLEALKDAIARSREQMAQEMGKVTGGLAGLPGMPGGLL